MHAIVINPHAMRSPLSLIGKEAVSISKAHTSINVCQNFQYILPDQKLLFRFGGLRLIPYSSEFLQADRLRSSVCQLLRTENARDTTTRMNHHAMAALDEILGEMKITIHPVAIRKNSTAKFSTAHSRLGYSLRTCTLEHRKLRNDH